MLQEIKKKIHFHREIHQIITSVRSQILSSVLFRVISLRLTSINKLLLWPCQGWGFGTEWSLRSLPSQSCDCLFNEDGCSTCTAELSTWETIKKALLSFRRLGVPDKQLPSFFWQTRVRCSRPADPTSDRKSSSSALMPQCHTPGDTVQDILPAHHPVHTGTHPHKSCWNATQDTFPLRLEVPIFSCQQESQVIFPNPPPLWTKHWGLSWVSLATRRTKGFFQLWNNQL